MTVQDTKSVQAVHVLPGDIVRGQIQCALDDIGADAIKIGMLGSGRIAAAVADMLRYVDLPLVLDPVLLSTSGAMLLDEEGLDVLKNQLMPRAFLATPNLPEAEKLVGILPKSDHSIRNAAQAFALLGVENILFKGGHGEGDTLRDVLVSGGKQRFFDAPRQDTAHTHGTGCTLATAIACGIAQKLSLVDAVTRAHSYLQNAIRTAPGLGAGHGPLNHLL